MNITGTDQTTRKNGIKMVTPLLRSVTIKMDYSYPLVTGGD